MMRQQFTESQSMAWGVILIAFTCIMVGIAGFAISINNQAQKAFDAYQEYKK